MRGVVITSVCVILFVDEHKRKSIHALEHKHTHKRRLGTGVATQSFLADASQSEDASFRLPPPVRFGVSGLFPQPPISQSILKLLCTNLTRMGHDRCTAVPQTDDQA